MFVYCFSVDFGFLLVCFLDLVTFCASFRQHHQQHPHLVCICVLIGGLWAPNKP